MAILSWWTKRQNLQGTSPLFGQPIGIAHTRCCLKCRPPGNRKPKKDEIVACIPYLKGQIRDSMMAQEEYLKRYIPPQFQVDALQSPEQIRGGGGRQKPTAKSPGEKAGGASELARPGDLVWDEEKRDFVTVP